MRLALAGSRTEDAARVARRLPLVFLLCCCLDCSDNRKAGPDSGTCDVDTDVDTDSDSDTDTDTDSDTDSDSDSDTDIDTDTDTDTASDTDTESGTSTDTDTGSDPCVEPDTDTQCEGQDEFAFCAIDTGPLYGVDYGYDICVGEVCLSPGSCGHACCNAPGPHFALPPAVIEAPSYTRSEPTAGQPVVQDTFTGLIWQGCAAGMDGDLASCSGTASELTWEDALAICDELDWAGQDDWYLPDPWELQSIAHYGVWCTALDNDSFPETPWERFWTSSSRASDADQAWFVSAVNGVVACDQKDSELLVRCVRREASPVPADRFARTEPVVGEPVVDDLATGLAWYGCAGGMTGDLVSCDGAPLEGLPLAAVTYCDLSTWGGHDDWRLPDIRELTSILELRNASPPLVDGEAFPSLPSAPLFEQAFWSATPYAPSPLVWQWQIDYSIGNSSLEEQTQYGFGICVRDPF